MAKIIFFNKNSINLFIFLFAILISQASHSNQLNTYGVTGLFNIPNADVQNFSDFSFSYNNVLDGDNRRDTYTKGENINATLGVYPRLEVGLRLLHYYSDEIHQKYVYKDFYRRDLSGNVKFQLPYLSGENLRFAVGGTDLAGLAVNFRRYYAVSSFKLGDFDLTAGYSLKPEGQRSDNGVLKGAFAGISYQPTDWVEFKAEKESAGHRAGVSFIWSEFLGFAGKLHVGGIVYNSHPDEPLAFNVGITWPIGGRHPGSDKMNVVSQPVVVSPLKTSLQQSKVNQTFKNESAEMASLPRYESSANDPLPIHDTIVTTKRRPDNLPKIGFVSDTPLPEKGLTLDHNAYVSEIIPPISGESIPIDTALRLRDALDNAGLDRVHIGVRQNTLIVVYENRLHNWSQTLALGALLNTLAEANFIDQFKDIEIYTLNRGIVLLKTRVTSDNLKFISKNAQSITASKVKPLIHYSQVNRYPDADWFFEPRRNEKVDITLTLAYRGYYGTEWDNWDYSIALRPIVKLPLWYGAHLSNVYHIGTQNSHNFEEGRVFNIKAFEDQMNELMIHQTLQPYPGLVNTFSLGQLSLGNTHFKGWMNQGEYQAFEGYGRLYWRQGSMKSNRLDTTLDYNAVGIEGHWHARNLTFGFQTGEYIEDDRSNIYYSRVRLGNAQVGLALTQSNITWERVDMSIMFPLGPRKNIALGPVTLGGDPLWFTGIGTVTDNPIAPKNNLIDINPGYKLVGASLSNSFNQSIHFFDNGRLTPAYMNNNYNQLLDAIVLAK
ncbi:YjbH domain-containing protein [Thiomicrospira microaerophila]|uniref:YjbH domain-containing protein n=1 Tax=Thiomicrospira microaerophila TaxID=406020 RepID=UPI00200E599E|nr:YjbH domain-containing protein [Thiomicrospira microaerophila]UQB43239.1 YjbH domain-containing protein [Thiomicrospira microaerophila]